MENEESEMMQEFGGIIRAMMGSGMQVAEQAQRRSHMSQMEAQAQFERERGLAEMLRRDLSSPTFWKSAGSEAVADRMIYASELAGRHDAASQAFMTGADRIRNQYGINVEDINRDHPGSAVERHHALRDALDDYLSSQRLNDEAQGKEQDTARELREAQQDPESQAKGELEQDAAEARQDESAHLSEAEAAESEVEKDMKNTALGESKEVTGQRDDPADRPLTEHSPSTERILAVWKEKGGKDADFPLPPTTRNPQTAMKNRQRVMAGAASQRTQSQELSR